MVLSHLLTTPHQKQFEDCNERISRMEEEHRRIGTVDHLRAQRDELKKTIHILNQEVQELTVRSFSPSHP